MVKFTINTNKKVSFIDKDIYGHFSEHLGKCIYEGLYVGENSDIPNKNGMRTDVVEALKEMKIPVLRWPGGCFADEYHWEDGIGPKEKRKKIINTHWGGVVEDNSFGTHEFMELCDQLGCEAYINGNVGSGTVREMSEWVEYLTFEGVSPMAELRKENGREKPWNVKYFGVGNENWGCGGHMTPEYYGNLYRHYQTYVRNYTPERKIRKIACGADAANYSWTDRVMKTCFEDSPAHMHGFMDGLAFHYYTVLGNWHNKGSATEFTEIEWYKTLNKTLKMETLIQRHGAIMDKYDPEGKVAMVIDEWGTWFDVEPGTNPGFLYQQNTMRDALVAGINLNLFNKYSKRVRACNIAQLVNVLQSVILTDGKDMILTPTYHVFNMYKHHQDATLLDSHIETKEIGLEEGCKVPNLSESVSVDDEGNINITLANLSLDESYEINTMIFDKEIKSVKGEILVNKMDAKNTFKDKEVVKTEEFTDMKITEDGLLVNIPPCSVLHIQVS